MSVPVAVWNKIEALEQAHAELAAKVDELDAKFDYVRNLPPYTPTGVYRILTGHAERLDALESPAPAPDPVCAICGGAGKRYTNGYCESCNGSGLITERVACANSDCGHTEDLHTHPAFGLGFCLRCPCPDYVPTAEPAPLDPVRSIMKLVLQYGADTANAAVCYRHNKDKEADDHNEKAYMRTQEIEAAIRAYGRDGAR